MERKIYQFVSARKHELGELSEIAETQDYGTLFHRKYDLTTEVQAYFLEELDAGDMQAIKELVRVFSKDYGQILTGEMPINAILPGDPYEYLDLSSKKKRAMIVKTFAEDKASHQEDLKGIRKTFYPIQPNFDAPSRD